MSLVDVASSTRRGCVSLIEVGRRIPRRRGGGSSSMWPSLTRWGRVDEVGALVDVAVVNEVGPRGRGGAPWRRWEPSGRGGPLDDVAVVEVAVPLSTGLSSTWGVVDEAVAVLVLALAVLVLALAVLALALTLFALALLVLVLIPVV